VAHHREVHPLQSRRSAIRRGYQNGCPKRIRYAGRRYEGCPLGNHYRETMNPSNYPPVRTSHGSRRCEERNCVDASLRCVGRSYLSYHRGRHQRPGVQALSLRGRRLMMAVLHAYGRRRARSRSTWCSDLGLGRCAHNILA